MVMNLIDDINIEENNKRVPLKDILKIDKHDEYRIIVRLMKSSRANRTNYVKIIALHTLKNSRCVYNILMRDRVNCSREKDAKDWEKSLAYNRLVTLISEMKGGNTYDNDVFFARKKFLRNLSFTSNKTYIIDLNKLANSFIDYRNRGILQGKYFNDYFYLPYMSNKNSHYDEFIKQFNTLKDLGVIKVNLTQFLNERFIDRKGNCNYMNNETINRLNKIKLMDVFYERVTNDIINYFYKSGMHKRNIHVYDIYPYCLVENKNFTYKRRQEISNMMKKDNKFMNFINKHNIKIDMDVDYQKK